MCLHFDSEITVIQCWITKQLRNLEFELYFFWRCLIMHTPMVVREEKTIELQGGMSNELYNTIARVTDGIYEGTARVYVAAVFL